MKNKNLTLSVRVHIKHENIKGLLDSASRGSSYWCRSGFEYESITSTALKEIGVVIEDYEEDKTHNLNIKKIKKGLTSMAKKDLQHFTDFINENYDQTTGDVFLQHCLFGKIIYG